MCPQWKTVLWIKWQIIYDVQQNVRSLCRCKTTNRCFNMPAIRAKWTEPNRTTPHQTLWHTQNQCVSRRAEDAIRYQIHIDAGQTNRNATKAITEKRKLSTDRKATHTELQTSSTNAINNVYTVHTYIQREHLWLWFVQMNEWMIVPKTFECLRFPLCVVTIWFSFIFDHGVGWRDVRVFLRSKCFLCCSLVNGVCVCEYVRNCCFVC